jgi:hypothetical protein
MIKIALKSLLATNHHSRRFSQLLLNSAIAMFEATVTCDVI